MYVSWVDVCRSVVFKKREPEALYLQPYRAQRQIALKLFKDQWRHLLEGMLSEIVDNHGALLIGHDGFYHPW
jgi:hypothetical protein